MKDCTEYVPAGFKLEHIKGYGEVMVKRYPKYCIIVEEVIYNWWTSGYKVVLLKRYGRDNYIELDCLPGWGERWYRFESIEEVKRHIAELLDINGFGYWINDVLNND